MSKIEELKSRAFLVMTDMAFLAEKDEYGIPLLVIVNLKNTTQILKCNIFNGNIRLRTTNMSEANKYKILLYIERNKEIIMKHLSQLYG